MSAEKKVLEGSSDVRYLEDIPMLVSGAKKTIVLTDKVEQFWQACFEKSKARRVCAVGSPGAGKSITMVYFIRILLENKKKVVYLNKTPGELSHHYVWEEGEDGNYTTAIYEEASPIIEVIKLAMATKWVTRIIYASQA